MTNTLVDLMNEMKENSGFKLKNEEVKVDAFTFHPREDYSFEQTISLDILKKEYNNEEIVNLVCNAYRCSYKDHLDEKENYKPNLVYENEELKAFIVKIYCIKELIKQLIVKT
jgi:hypothetical protein